MLRHNSQNKSFGSIVFTLILSFTLTSFAQSPATQITLGGLMDDNAAQVLQVDGGFSFAGNTYTGSAGGRDAMVFETDFSGLPIMSTVFGGSADESAIGIAKLPEGGYVVTGRTTSHGFGSVDIYFARLNAEGDVTHFKTYGGDNEDRSMGLIPTQDGQFLIFGATRNGSLNLGTVQDVALLKVTEYGDVIWTRAIGGPISEVAYSVKETANGDFIVFAYGDSWENQQVSPDMYIIKINKNGDVIWTRGYGGQGFEMITSASAGYISPDDDIYIMGATNSYGVGDYDQILMKLDDDGSMLWSRTIGGEGYDYGRGVTQTSVGEILAWGLTTDPENDTRDGLVSKFTTEGVHIWSKAYGSDGTDDIYRITELEGDSLFMVGRTDSYGSGGNDIWLVRTNSEGEVRCNQTMFQPTVQSHTIPLRNSDAFRGTIRLEVSEVDITTISVSHTSFLEPDTICTSTVDTRSFNDGLIPDTYRLAPNSPNPFNPSTEIHFELPVESEMTLSIFNVKGQLVQELIINESLPAGYHSRQWDGRNAEGKDQPSGVYFCRMQVDSFVQKQEMLLLK